MVQAKRDTGGRGVRGGTGAAGDIGVALGLLTRLPVPRRAGLTEQGAASAWAWPLVGLLVCLIAALAGAAAGRVGLTPAVAAGLVIGVQVLVTGALHEDGLADAADGLWGGWDRARRLEIMHDSRIGAYGVIALILGLGLRWSALTALAAAGGLEGGLVAAAMLSRAAMAAMMGALPAARSDGLGHSVGRPAARLVWIGIGIATLGAVLALGWGAGLVAAAAVALVALVWGAFAKAQVGGQTGDILGAGQQLTEIAALCVAVALI